MIFYRVIGLLFYISVNCGTGFYVQPDVLFLSEHPRSQLILTNSSFSLSCAVQLRGLRAEEGVLGVPIVQWSINETNIPTVFPDAVVSQTLSPSHLLRSTLTIPYSSHNHSGTYHCNIIDGTSETETLTDRQLGLCEVQCFPFVTVSNPATITVLGNSTSEEVVLDRCSSVVLECGSLLPTQGLRPLLQWKWNGTTLDGSSNSYRVLNSGDLALYHSHESDMIGTFCCVASSDDSSAILATYTVVEGDPPNSPSLWLAVSPSSQVVEDDTFSLILVSSGMCLRNNTQSCVWTRNSSHICPESSGDILDVQSESRFSCEDHVLTISSASPSLHSGLYCCQMENDVNGAVCVDIQVVKRAAPLLISSHNGTTLTTNTSHNAHFTLSCTATHPYLSHYWLYNGVRILEDGGPLVVRANLSSVGVYQCIAGNEFGYAVATLRILPERFTNPPGQPTSVEIPRPDKWHRGAYLFSWQPPSYPLNLSNDVVYSTSGQQPKENFVEIFISHASYYSIAVSVTDKESGDQLSERTVSNFQTFYSECRRYVYFPPLLSADCIRGQASVTWRNNPDNVEYYPKGFYSVNGPVPGKYYINITCSLLNDTLLKTDEIFTEEGSTVFEDGLPAGAHCVFSGAATPASGPARCRDPAAIFYRENASCQITTLVEFENNTYVVNEGVGYHQICLNSSGYDFYANFSATYHDNDNFTEVTEVFVDGVDSTVCVNVSVRNDATVNEARTIFLTLGSDNDLVFTGPPATITVLDDDVVIVGFTESLYEMVPGQLKEVCVSAEGELERTVSVNMSVMEQHGTAAKSVELDEEELTFDSSHYEVCVTLNASSAITQTTLVVLTLTIPDEEGAIALSIGTANVTISPPKEPGYEAPISAAVIVVLVIVLLLIAVVICVVGVLVLGWCNTRHTKLDIVETLFTETSTQPLKEYMLKPQQFKFGSIPTICEDLYMESTNALFDVSDSVLERGVSTNDELKLPERNFEQENNTNEVSEDPDLKKESSISQYSSTTSSSNPEYITSESLLLYSPPPSVGSNYPIPPAKVAEDNITDDNTATHNNFGGSGMDSGVLGTSSGISGMNCNTVGMNKDSTSTVCMGSLDPFGGNMNMLNDSELSSLFHPSGDSGIGMDSGGNTT